MARETRRTKVQLSIGIDWLARLDRVRGSEPRSYYIERVTQELWDRDSFKRPPPDEPTSHELFFGVGR